MLLSNTRLGVKPSKFDHYEINIHSSATQHYGRHTALRGRLAALGFTPLFTRVERLSAGLALTGRASAAGMGAAGMGTEGPTGMGTALGLPLCSLGWNAWVQVWLWLAVCQLHEWVQREWVRQEANQQSQADPARTHPDQGTVGGPEPVFPVSAPLRQQPMVLSQATGNLHR